MSLIIPPGFAEISVGMRNDNDPDPWYVTFGVVWELDVYNAQQQTQRLGTSWADIWKAFLSTDTHVVSSQSRIGQDGGDPLTLDASFDIAGTSTAAKLPQNCALLIRKVTETPGRRGKGRNFLPNVLNESKVTNYGVIDSDFVSDLQLAADGFLGTLETPEPGSHDPAPMVLLHNSGTGPTTPSPVVSYQVQATIATQRRRLR